MKLIAEYTTEGLGYSITENKKTGKKETYIEGVFMQAEGKNRNGRIYTREVLTMAVDKYNNEQVMTGRAVGELNHPDGPYINLDKVSHRITELKWDGNNVIGKALILDTPMGQIVKGLVEGGVQLSVSSRGMGSLESKNGVSYVKDDFHLSAVDIEHDPSAPNAFVNGIMEGEVETEKKEAKVKKESKKDKFKEDLVDEVDGYLNYVVENWMKEFEHFTDDILKKYKSSIDEEKLLETILERCEGHYHLDITIDDLKDAIHEFAVGDLND